MLQDTVLDLIDLGKIRAASGSAFTLSHKARARFFNELYRYKEKLILRPVEISNSPEVIRRLGVIAINTAIEVDIYGQVNSTHVMGSQLMNGIGGSGDFLRNGAVSFIVTPSTAKDSRISSIVPMVSHVDHSEHSVDVIVTEYGLVDTRPLTPRQVAEQIIKKCAHPQYRDLLWDYFQRAIKKQGGHEPHLLKEVFNFHQRFIVRLGNTTLAFNCMVLLAGALLFPLEKVLYTLIYIYVSARILNLVVTGLSHRKAVMIVSNHAEAISSRIMEDIKRGVTILNGQGAYSGRDEKVLYTVVTFRELSRVKQLIRQMDPQPLWWSATPWR